MFADSGVSKRISTSQCDLPMVLYQDRLIRHIDNDTPVNDPPYAVPALYDHLQSDTYRKLEELQVIIHEQLGEG